MIHYSTWGYQNVQPKYTIWWPRMKNVIVDFVAKYLTYQQVKVEHQRPGGLLAPLKILKWKWEEMTINFVMDLSRTRRRHDAIWVIMDRMMKPVHFLAVRVRLPLESLTVVSKCQDSFDFLIKEHWDMLCLIERY